MEILNRDNGEKGMFYVEANGHILAEITYVWSGSDKIIVDHTEVSNTLAGKGVGKQLVMKVVDMAHEKNIKIIPLCPFAKGIFDKNPAEFLDILF